jgi:hypothetical protein
MMCPACKPESVMIYATLAPPVGFYKFFDTADCNTNHINTGHEPLPETKAQRML